MSRVVTMAIGLLIALPAMAAAQDAAAGQKIFDCGGSGRCVPVGRG
jgi:hypothetical protein